MHSLCAVTFVRDSFRILPCRYRYSILHALTRIDLPRDRLPIPSPFMPSEPMSRTTAAVTIQHFARARVLSSGQSARNMWSNIANKEALEKLRALYLDERAIRAGARESALYTDEMLARREALRSHELVHRALENLWVSIPRVAASQLSKDEYMTLARKLYLIKT
jgi:hypothetical protein